MKNINADKQQKSTTAVGAKTNRGKRMRKERYLNQAHSQIVLAEVYLKDTTGKHGEKDILYACEKAIDYMDAFLKEDYNVIDLLTTYVEGCKSAISVLLELKSQTALAKGIELCERFGNKITAEKSVEDKNDAILEIAQLLALLNAARNVHESAIEGFELVKRIQKIQFKRQKSRISRAMIAQSNLNLAAEHISTCDLNHYEKAMDCYIEAMTLFIEDCYNGKIRIIDALFFNHSLKEAFDDSNSDCLHNARQGLVSALHKDMMDFKVYISNLRNKNRALDLYECVEGLKKYSEMLDRIKELTGSNFKDSFFQKKNVCYLQISDLLLEMGDFYESKKYSDLAKQIFLSTI